MDNLIAAGIVILALWAIITFVGAYWQIILALAAIGGLVYMLFRSNEKPGNKPEELAEPQPGTVRISTFVDEDGNKWHTADLPDGSWYMERGVGEPFETYYNLSETIRTSKDVDTRLAAC